MDSRLVWATTAVAVAAGIAIEVAVGSGDGVPLAGLDAGVGVLLLVEGAIATVWRPASRSGWWFALSGVAWFAGTLGWPLVYLHRGPLVQLHLSYPSGRVPRSWVARIAILTAYVDALILPLARDDRLTVALSVLVVVAALRTFRASAGPARRALLPALVAAIAFAGVLSLGAVLRLAGVEARLTVLWTYDLVIAAMATLLLVDLLRASWSRAVLTGLVVELGDLRGPAMLRDRLAAALGDPTATIGTWDDARGAYLDEDGTVVAAPAPGMGRTATVIDDDAGPVALLVHGDEVAADPELVGAVATAARLAVDNARLEARIGSQMDEIAASRRRLVEVADHERQALQRAIDDGPARRLEVVASLVGDAGLALEPSGPLLGAEARAAIAELHELADGLRPAALEGGLAVALAALARRSALPVRVVADVPRLPDPIEAAAYFVVAESLANAAKHAGASACVVAAALAEGVLAVDVADDGSGGADPAGAGLRGLHDRVEALGGRFAVEPAAGGGTRVRAWLPAVAGIVAEPVGASPEPWSQQPSLS
jgi:signal transduction histidine kinase